MAVTFKVPSSPKRDIDATDTFMGVDLTNTGVSMDIYRSPNAPNMVRDVPGKVRKRMGYYKEIFFGKPENVNFASGTSSVSKEIHFSPAEAGTAVNVYDLIQSLTGELYLEFDYISDDDFTVCGVEIEAAQPDEDGNWAHFSGSFTGNEITTVSVNSETAQAIYVKNFSIMKSIDENYVWSPAPKYFVERASNDPIYGVHYLRNNVDGSSEDKVSYVNRALNTSATETIYEFEAGGGTRKLYDLAENFGGVDVYVRFEGSLTGTPTQISRNAYIKIGEHEQTVILPDFYGSHTVVFRNLKTDALTVEVRVQDDNPQSTGSRFRFKKFSVFYVENYVPGAYKWSPAPEDSSKTFDIDKVYDIGRKDYAAATGYNDTSTSARTVTKKFDIYKDNIRANRATYLSFDITTSDTETTLTSLNVSLIRTKSNGNEGEVLLPLITDSSEHLRKRHYNLFVKFPNDETYPNVSLKFVYTFSANSKAITEIKNIKVRDYEKRTNYKVSPKWYLYHVGKEFYLKAVDSDRFESIYQDANEHISRSWQLKNNCYIIDGKDIYQFQIDNGQTVDSIGQENAYIPTVTIAKEPSGGGTSLDAFNLLQPGFYELFQGKASVKDYQLTFGDLDDTEVEAWVLSSSAEWVRKVENTDFTVNRATGKVTFTTAPGVTPIDGEDNVKILAYRTVDGYRDRITKCTTGILFGVNGAADRLFLTGNGEHPNWDFYSQMNDPTYFPDTGYSVLGSEQSQIIGYSVVSNYLASFKDGFDQSQAVFIREGDLLKTEDGDEETTTTSEPVFKLINTLQGEGAVASYSFGYLQTEPLFLTKSGIYAITEQDITGEKYSQNRSFYLDGVLRKEPNLKDAQAVVYDDQYVLLLNNKLFILDGLQATRTDKSEPYATRQYAGFLCEDIPALTIWTDDAICFGTTDGRVCRFYTDPKDLNSYNDDGKPIYACWETPDLDDKLFYKNKTFRYLAVRLMQSIKTTARMYSRKLGVWTKISENMVISNPIDFENFDFELFTFSVDTTEKLLHTKVRVKKVDKARFKVENDVINEPFGLSDLALEYIQSGNYKG